METALNSIMKYRRMSKLTQSELAHRAGISTYLLRRYENNELPIERRHLEPIAEALGVAPSELLPLPSIKQTVSELMLKNRSLLENPDDQFARGYHAALMAVLEVYETNPA